jgi:hypothetical protein
MQRDEALSLCHSDEKTGLERFGRSKINKGSRAGIRPRGGRRG